jgi:hypothetical protein
MLLYSLSSTAFIAGPADAILKISAELEEDVRKRDGKRFLIFLYSAKRK